MLANTCFVTLTSRLQGRTKETRGPPDSSEPIAAYCYCIIITSRFHKMNLNASLFVFLCAFASQSSWPRKCTTNITMSRWTSGRLAWHYWRWLLASILIRSALIRHRSTAKSPRFVSSLRKLLREFSPIMIRLRASSRKIVSERRILRRRKILRSFLLHLGTVSCELCNWA